MKRKIVAADADPGGLAAAARVLAAGGRVPKKFAKARPESAGPTLGAAAAGAKITPARRVAFEVLSLVAAGKGHSDELLHGVRMEALSEADKHLATALVMGVLRWGIALDAEVRRFLERPGQALPPAVTMVLRLGALQLLHMDRIPAHAALSESVEMCRAAGHPHAAGMVNAILRKVAAGAQAERKVPIFETTAAFAERLGHPLWLVDRWVANYGRAAALAICEANQREPDQREPDQREPDQREPDQREPDQREPDQREPDQREPDRRKPERGGLFAAEAELPLIDDGSRLVAEIAAAALPQVEGRAARVWDCCAAPGGKTLVLAARLPSAQILATDVSAKRLAAMEKRVRRSKLMDRIRMEVADAGELGAAEGEFDLILCDVPCSGTGTLGRNPEIRDRLKPEELQRQATRQGEILRAGLSRLAPGGRLVYSTCSLEPEENEQVIVRAADGWRRLPIRELTASTSGLRDEAIQNEALRTLPGLDPCDGFFTVVLERPGQ